MMSVSHSRKKGKQFLSAVTTFDRLERAALPFEARTSAARPLAPAEEDLPHAVRIARAGWAEQSLGDPLNKLILVEQGCLDLGGASGGWLVVPNHLVFIPAGRAFAVSTADAVLTVGHLDPADAPWPHAGCWVTGATPLAREMLAQATCWAPDDVREEPGARAFFRAISHLCRDWFSNPRMLWTPAVKSEEMRRAVHYVRANLRDATLQGACAASGLAARTFQRRCEQELSFPWRSFLREVRIMRAMEMLSGSSVAVGAVAEETGFGSIAAFTTSFSDRIGMAPGEFRRRYAPVEERAGPGTGA
jgi:AraC-like DNA-binding protein